MSATNRTTARGGKGSKSDKTNKPDKGDTGKGSADKVHQSGAGDSVRSNKNEDPAIKEKIRQIIELTQSSENEACLALHESDNDTERAVNFIFENRDQNWETRVKKKKSRQTSTSKDGASPAATGSTTDNGGNNSTAMATAVTGGGDDDDWCENPTDINTSGALSGGGNTGTAAGGGNGYGSYDKTRGTSRGSGGPRMHGRQGGIGNNSGRDRDREGGGGSGGSWRGKERHENARNLDEGGGAGRRGRPGLPPRGGGGARGRGGGRAGGSSRYPPRAPQNRHTNSNYNNRMGTWDNSNTWDGGNSRDEVNHHSTAADDNWDEFHGEEWSTEEYTGSLSETKVFTSSQPTEPTLQDQDPSPIIPALETTTSTLSTSGITVEQSMVQAQLAQMAQMQQAAEAAVSVHQSAGGTVPPQQQQTQQVQQQQSQPAPVAIVGTLNAEQAKYLNTLTQQNNMNISAGIKYAQQPQQPVPQSQVQQSQYSVTQTQTTGYISNYGQPYADNTMQQQQQQQSQQPRIKQRARIPPPSKIPSSAVEMPGDLNSTMGLLDLQFGAMDIMLDVTGSNVFVGGYDSNDGKYSGNLDTSGMQQQQSSATASSMDLNHSSVQQQHVIPQQQQQQQMVDVYSPTKPSQQQQQSSISSALSQGLENMQSVGVGNIAGGGDHIQTVTGYNTGVRSGVVPSSTTGTNTSLVGVTSVGVGGSAIDTMTKVQQANVVDHQQQQQAQQAAVAAAAAAAQQQQQQQHTYSQQTNFNTVYGSGPTTVAKSNVASVGSNYQTQQQAYSTNNYSTNSQKPTDFQTANYNYASNNGGGGGGAGTANYNTSGTASNSAYQPYSNSNSYQQSTGSGNTTFITQANTYPANVATNPTYQQNTSQSVYGANTGLNNSTNYTGSSNSTSASAQYNSYGSSSGGTTATNHKPKDGNSAYDGGNSAGGVSGVVTSNTSSAAAAAALSLAQTTATSGSKVNTTLAKNSSGVVTNLPPGVTPVMSAPYLMASNTIPYFQQQPIYQYDELQLMQQRLPHMTAPFYDMSYQTPAAAATALRDGSYSMSSDGRFARSDSNASPVPSTQTSSQPLALAQTAPGAYFFAAPYANIQPGYQFGPAAAMYSQLPTGTNAHNANNSTPQYAKQQQQPSAATAYSGGYGYDSLSQVQDYGKSSGGGGGGYVGGGGGGGGGSTVTGGSTGGSGSGSQGGQSKPGSGGVTTNVVSVTGGPTGTVTGGSTNDLSAMYAKSHNTLGKVNSYDKQGFHSGTPPPFTGTLGQTGALAPSGTGYAPQMYIQQLPAHHQQHSTPLMHQPLHQMEVRHHGRRMDGGNNSGQRTQSSNPSKTGSKQGYQSSYWNAP